MSRLVLIVEDSETCAETLQIALEPIPGVEVRSIHSRRAAIALLNDRRQRDCGDCHGSEPRFERSPGQWIAGDGLDLIRQLRAEPRFARVPILLISGDSDPLLSARAFQQGADAFFAKPYSPSAVRKKLEQLLC